MPSSPQRQRPLLRVFFATSTCRVVASRMMVRRPMASRDPTEIACLVIFGSSSVFIFGRRFCQHIFSVPTSVCHSSILLFLTECLAFRFSELALPSGTFGLSFLAHILCCVTINSGLGLCPPLFSAIMQPSIYYTSPFCCRPTRPIQSSHRSKPPRSAGPISDTFSNSQPF